jgi:hypothetical protein
MRKVLALTLLGLMFTVVLASCGSSQGGHCDAYGNKSGCVNSVEKSDLPS